MALNYTIVELEDMLKALYRFCGDLEAATEYYNSKYKDRRPVDEDIIFYAAYNFQVYGNPNPFVTITPITSKYAPYIEL